MLAYRIRDVAAAAASERLHDRSHAGLARLAIAGPWQFAQHPEGGCVATWLGSKPRAFDSLGDGEACEDGMVYYRPDPLPGAMDLAKSKHSEDEIDVDLECGVRLSILLAISAPRRLRFTGGAAIGDPLSEYGLLARDVQRRLAEAPADQPLTVADAGVRRLLFLAVAQRYRVTEELLNDLGWLSTADVDPLLCAIWGSDPKAFAAATGI